MFLEGKDSLIRHVVNILSHKVSTHHLIANTHQKYNKTQIYIDEISPYTINSQNLLESIFPTSLYIILEKLP